MFLIPPIDFLGCSLRVVFLTTFKLPFCNSCPLVRIETCIVLPLVVALVLDPECSLRCRQVSSILLETLIRSGLDHLPLFSRLISVGYLVGLVRLRRLCLAFIRSIMPALFLLIEKYAEISWAVVVFKDSRSTNDSSGFPPNHEVGNESGSSSIEISWFVAFSRKRRLCKVLYELAVAF